MRPAGRQVHAVEGVAQGIVWGDERRHQSYQEHAEDDDGTGGAERLTARPGGSTTPCHTARGGWGFATDIPDLGIRKGHLSLS